MSEALSPHVSETSLSREVLAPYCDGIGIDAGYGGDKVVPHAWAFDMPQAYTNVGTDRQQLRGDCRHFPFLCDGALDWIHSAHLLEDFTYAELIPILSEWRRVIRMGGVIITNCPNQQRFLTHCAKTGQGLNLAHKEATFSLQTFKSNVLDKTGPWETVFEQDNFGPYSWLLVVRKVESAAVKPERRSLLR